MLRCVAVTGSGRVYGLVLAALLLHCPGFNQVFAPAVAPGFVLCALDAGLRSYPVPLEGLHWRVELMAGYRVG